tara:strand:- start:318 stop:584 length:267 start_codon:yes stop_codon:yes gene_type:complete
VQDVATSSLKEFLHVHPRDVRDERTICILTEIVEGLTCLFGLNIVGLIHSQQERQIYPLQITHKFGLLMHIKEGISMNVRVEMNYLDC